MKLQILVLLVMPFILLSQTSSNESLSFGEFIDLVKTEHPITKQANLKIEEGNAKLTKARGGFDPKLEGGFNTKEFKDKQYYDQLNAKLKVPTWYGVELQAGFEDNSGVFLNPENNVPNNGLYSAGLKASLGQGLFINKRMADLKKAKAYQNQTIAERQLLVNHILYNASTAYFNWVLNYKNLNTYKSFLENASFRLSSVKKQVIAGEKAGIDSLEASITVDNRKLQYQQAKIEFNKSRLKVSSYLWMNNTPLELLIVVTPIDVDDNQLDEILAINDLTTLDMLSHPKILALGFKTKSLEIDKRLKANKLLPKIDASYNFVTQNADVINSYYNSNYKAKIGIALPLFLRKERGDLKIAKLKLQAINFETENTKLSLANKIKGLQFEVSNYNGQIELINTIAANYETLLSAEERKFNLGESSLFLINSREKSLIDAKIKVNKISNKYFITKAKLFNALGIMP